MKRRSVCVPDIWIIENLSELSFVGFDGLGVTGIHVSAVAGEQLREVAALSGDKDLAMKTHRVVYGCHSGRIVLPPQPQLLLMKTKTRTHSYI